EMVETARQPPVTSAEFEHALEVLRGSAEFGAALRDGTLQPYRPMPPHVPAETPDGGRELRIAVGLLPANGGAPRHEVVAVSLAAKRVDRFDGNAPPTSLAVASVCGVPAAAGQETADQGRPGSAKIRVLRGGTVLWELVATRPAASAGTATSANGACARTARSVRGSGSARRPRPASATSTTTTRTGASTSPLPRRATASRSSTTRRPAAARSGSGCSGRPGGCGARRTSAAGASGTARATRTRSCPARTTA